MDRGYALAWRRDKAETCTGCGTRADEWAEDEHAYIGDFVYCEGCARIAEEQNNTPKDDRQPRPGYHVFLHPREQYEAAHPPGTPIDH
jgi:predicted Fe-S protein YdhL (DUF1289 family)